MLVGMDSERREAIPLPLNPAPDPLLARALLALMVASMPASAAAGQVADPITDVWKQVTDTWSRDIFHRVLW
jgi:hypothetical protein